MLKEPPPSKGFKDNAKMLIVVNVLDFFYLFVSPTFWFLEVCQVPGGFKQLREVRRIHFLLSLYLSEAVGPSYVHLSEKGSYYSAAPRTVQQ